MLKNNSHTVTGLPNEWVTLSAGTEQSLWRDGVA
ncbi:hypothetical protein ABIE50_003101 [Chitinophaga sp. OAE865]